LLDCQHLIPTFIIAAALYECKHGSALFSVLYNRFLYTAKYMTSVLQSHACKTFILLILVYTPKNAIHVTLE